MIHGVFLYLHFVMKPLHWLA